MRKDVIWNSLGTSAWSFLSLFLLVLVTRINGIEDSGTFSFVFAVALVVFTLSCYGGRTFQVSDHHRVFSTSGYVSLRLVTTAAAMCFTVLFVLISDYDEKKSTLIFVLAAHRAFDAIADVLYGALQKQGRLHVAGKSLFYKSVLSVLAFLVVDLLTRDIVIASLTLPIISLLFVALYDLPQSRKAEDLRISPWSNEVPGALKATFLPFVIATFGLLFVNVSRYFVDLYHPTMQGYFGIIIMPLSLIILLFSFISTPVVLTLSIKFNNREFRDLNRVVVRIILLVVAVTFVLMALIYSVGAPALTILFGVDLQEYVVDVVLVAMIGAAISLSSLFMQIATIARKLRFTALTYVLATAFLSGLCAAFVDRFQIRGAILAYVVASLLQVIVMGCYYLSLLRRGKGRMMSADALSRP